MNEKDKTEASASIKEGWARISEYRFDGLTEQEIAQFERAQFAEEQAQKTSFIFGEPLRFIKI